MAHLEKYQAAAVGHMMAHYDRRGTAGRDNIDPELTERNYTLVIMSDGVAEAGVWMRGSDGGWITQGRGADAVRAARDEVNAARAAAGKRKLRKDAVLMMDWVVTAPADLPERDEQRFFAAAYEYIAETYGAANVLGGRVHRDEPGARSHMHVPVIPRATDANGVPTLNAKALTSRGKLKAFHAGLQSAVDGALGYHVSVLLDETQQAQKQLSHLKHADYERATAEIERTAARLESVRRAVEDALEQGQLSRAAGREIVEAAGEVERRADEAELAEQAARERAEELRTRCDETRERADGLRSRLREAEAEHRRLAVEVRAARGRARSLRRSVTEAWGRVTAAAAAGDLTAALVAAVRALARRLGVGAAARRRQAAAWEAGATAYPVDGRGWPVGWDPANEMVVGKTVGIPRRGGADETPAAAMDVATEARATARGRMERSEEWQR